MKKVVLVATGGTIASRYDAGRGDVGVGSTGSAFVDLARHRLPDVEVEAADFAAVGSYMLTLPMAFELVKTIRATLARADVDGVVVTHGTDTLEESAYLADLLIGSAKPVVFTGAQLAADDPESDGPRNFLSAVMVAASEEARGMGVLVVFEQEIHAARDVTKIHASRVGTFGSMEHGKLGEVDLGRVIFHRRPLVASRFDNSEIEANVDLVKLAMGLDARFIDCSVASGAKGIVVEAFGRGNVTPEVLKGIERALAAGVTVAVTTRCPSGRVAPIYTGSGGAGLERAGVHFLGDLSGIKARLLLAVVLASGLDEKARAEALAAASA